MDGLLRDEPMGRWVLSVPFPLRFLFAGQPKIMGKVLGIVYRTLATHLMRRAGYTITEAHTDAVTLIRRFGSALKLNIHFHKWFIDGVYVDSVNGLATRFRWIKAQTSEELTGITRTIARRIARFLECQGLLERDAGRSYLASTALADCGVCCSIPPCGADVARYGNPTT